MPRMARYWKCMDAPYQHVWNRVAGSPDYYPFSRRRARHHFFRLLRRYLDLYYAHLYGGTLMGNHFHMVLGFDSYRELPRDELEEKARQRWGKQAKRHTASWQDDDWEEFNRNLFDLSRFMSHLENEFSKWFNRTYNRRGHFWAGRFNNNGLYNLEAVLDTVLYTELNPVRANLVKRPEEWKAGTAYLRAHGKDDWLVPLAELFPDTDFEDLYRKYRYTLIFRGTLPGKEGDAKIPEWILQEEARRGFARPGTFLKNLPLFRRGVGLGSRDEILRQVLKLRERGYFKQRDEPVGHMGGIFFTVCSPRGQGLPP